MKKIKKIIPVLLVILLALSLTPFASAANSGLIESGKTGSITIHKFDNTGTDTGLGNAGNGTEIANTTGFGNPLNGIEFKVTLIPGATGTTTVEQAKQYIADNTVSPTQTGTTGSGTNADGVYKFDGLAQGIYLVEEADNDAVTGTVEAFLVSIPMTNPVDQSSWLYDIHVYPKNKLTDVSIAKDVLDSEGNKQSSISASIGEEVNWVISATIPGGLSLIDPTSALGYFYITDNLDSRLNYKAVSVELVSPSGTRETLTKDTHYKLDAEPNIGAPGTGDDDIVVNFKTAAGLAKLIAAPVGSTIEITVTTVINNTAMTDLSDSITNSTELYFNNEDGDPTDPTDPPTTPEDPDPEVELEGIVIEKVDENGNPLDGAVFTIYATSTNAESGTAVETVPSSGINWTEKSGESLVIVGSNPVEYVPGYIYFSGSDLEAAGLEAMNVTYYFVETKAPDGYELLNTIHALKTGTTTRITNEKSPNFTLPITGGSGTILFTIAGILLIGGAVTLLLVSRKKKNASK